MIAVSLLIFFDQHKTDRHLQQKKQLDDYT